MNVRLLPVTADVCDAPSARIPLQENTSGEGARRDARWMLLLDVRGDRPTGLGGLQIPRKGFRFKVGGNIKVMEEEWLLFSVFILRTACHWVG